MCREYEMSPAQLMIQRSTDTTYLMVCSPGFRYQLYDPAAISCVDTADTTCEVVSVLSQPCNRHKQQHLQKTMIRNPSHRKFAQ